MAGFIDRSFKGQIPRLAAHQLPDGNAQIARSCDLRHGDLRGLPNGGPVLLFTNISDPKTLYTQDGTNFLAFQDRAHIVRHPTSGATRFFASAGGLLWGSTLFNHSCLIRPDGTRPPYTIEVYKVADPTTGERWKTTIAFRKADYSLDYYFEAPGDFWQLVGPGGPSKPPRVEVVPKASPPADLSAYIFAEQNGQRVMPEINIADAAVAQAGTQISEEPSSYGRKYLVRYPALNWPKLADGVTNDKSMVPGVCLVFSKDGAEIGRVYSSNTTAASASTGVTATANAESQTTAGSVLDQVSAIYQSHYQPFVSPLLTADQESALRSYGDEMAALDTNALWAVHAEYDTEQHNYANNPAIYNSPSESARMRALAADAIIKARSYGATISPTSGSRTNATSSQTATTTYTSYEAKVEVEQKSWVAAGNDGYHEWYVRIQLGKQDARSYCYTYINRFGDESPPSPASDVVLVDDWQDVKLTPQEEPPAGYGIHGGRVYRTATGESGSTDWFLVGGSDINDPAIGNWTTYHALDNIPAARLGGVLPSKDWKPAPAGLAGLCMLANGSLAAHVDHDVWMTVPYRPYAWQYQIKLPYKIRAISPLSSGLVAVTEEGVYVLQGSDPAYFSVQRLPGQTTTFDDTLWEMDGRLIMPTWDGLALINGVSIDLSTSNQFWTKPEWMSWVTSRFGAYRAAAYFDQKLAAFFDHGGFVCDFQNGNVIEHGVSGVTAVYYLPKSDTLYLVAGPLVLSWNDMYDQLPATYFYRSKIRRFPYPISLGAAKVTGVPSVNNGLPIGPSGKGVIINVIADDTLVCNHQYRPGDPLEFRLPSGHKALEWYYELLGDATVTEVHLAESMAGLRDG